MTTTISTRYPGLPMVEWPGAPIGFRVRRQAASPFSAGAVRFLLGVATLLFLGHRSLTAADLSRVPLWDGETATVPDGPLINRFGGQPIFGGGSGFNVSRTTSVVRGGTGAYRIATLQSIAPGGFGFFQTALAPGSSLPTVTPGRNLTRYDNASFWLKNETGSAFTLKFEIKDYRDSASHQAFRRIVIPANSTWQPYAFNLDLNSAGWSVVGTPDMQRGRLLGFVVEANQNQAVQGSFFLDDLSLTEKGGPLDSATAPLGDLAGRLAARQFDALWSSRNRVNGLVPLGSTIQDVGGLNTTSALVQLLPGAVTRGWVTQQAADQYMTTLVGTLNTALNQSNFLPPRYLRMDTLAPDFPEESSVDAAFLALALHRYKSLPQTPSSLASAIDQVQNRFNFAAFSDTQSPNVGWKLAFRTDTNTFTSGTYDGYSGEPWLISLAAHLADTNSVDIRTHYHSAVFRQLAQLVNPADAHLVHSFPQFRAPFLQWLLPLFVDVSDRGVDSFPNYSLASNPVENAEKYQREVHAWFAQQGRGLFLQPDAGSNVAGTMYEQFSAYQNFGQPNLFMPWSAAFSLMGNEGPGEAGLRNSIANELHGPFGLSDAVEWTTGASRPSQIVARHDFWNTALSAMGLSEYLYGDSQFFTQLPEVAAALDRVFFLTWEGPTDGLWGNNRWNGTLPPPTIRHDAQIVARTVTVGSPAMARRTRIRSGRLHLQSTLTSPVQVLPEGALSGTGTIIGDVLLEGSFQIEHPSFPLSITGQLILGPQSTLTVEQTDLWPRGGQTGDRVLLTTTEGITGGFSNPAGAGIDSHLGQGVFLLEVRYADDRVVADFRVALPGDANGDGIVDGSDFGIWNANKFRSGTDWTTGDFNHDGITDGADFGLWNAWKFSDYRGNLLVFEGFGSAPGHPVPEPFGGAWFAFAWMGISAFRRGKARWDSRSRPNEI